MGTTTFFKGEFKLNHPLDESTKALINKLCSSRRMQRHVNPHKYGLQGEFYVLNHDYSDDSHKVVDGNSPPQSQAGLWCKWEVNDKGTAISWNEHEKFYNSAEWIYYIQQKILIPRGYDITGIVNAKTEDDERYHIIAEGGKVRVEEGFHPDVSKPQIRW